MIGIILTGHGTFASAMAGAAKLLVGEAPIVDIDYQGEDTASFEAKLDGELNRFPADIPVLVLCDLLGGTPFRLAATRAQGRKNVRVIYGTNLNMLVEACMCSFEEQAPAVDDLASSVTALGKDQIGVLNTGTV